MRISFLGKGGSGKTTLSVGFTKFLAKQSNQVLAIDADINVHMARLLKKDREVPHIGSKFSDVSAYLMGARTDLETMVATTPPSLSSNFIRPNGTDPFVNKFGLVQDDLSILAVGAYEQEDLGHTCYHGKLNVLEMVYHHLLDKKHEYVIADATAGIDNLGTSLFFAYDVNVFVVEPTLKSIQVYKDYQVFANAKKIKTLVIINKFEEGDLEFVQKHIPLELIVGFVPLSRTIKELEQGDIGALDRFVDEQAGLFIALKNKIDAIEKDWATYYELLLNTHKQNSLEWWDSYYQKDIANQFDPDFSYDKVFSRYD